MCSRTAAAWTPPVAALAAQAGTFYALRVTTALPQAVAAAGGRLGRAEQDLAAKVAPGTLLGLGREAEGHRPRGAARCDRPSPQLRTDAGALDRCGEDAAPKVTRGNLAQQC